MLHSLQVPWAPEDLQTLKDKRTDRPSKDDRQDTEKTNPQKNPECRPGSATNNKLQEEKGTASPT